MMTHATRAGNDAARGFGRRGPGWQAAVPLLIHKEN
jgi:hypothetical protein